MIRINYLHLYILGFIFWSMLLLMQLCHIPYEKISQISAQIELFLHLFVLVLAFKICAQARSSNRKILFWLIPINIGLFLNDLIFYFIFYFSENNTFNLQFTSFLINILPYSIWNISTLIFLIYIVREIFTSKNFIKMLSMLMLINCSIIYIFFNSIQSVFNYFSWQNISQIITSLIELIIYDLSILSLIYSEKRGLSFIVVGFVILISGDFIISYSFLTQTNTIAAYGELFWLLGMLCIFFGMLELKNQTYLKERWLRSTNSIKGKLAFWAFGISIVNILPFFVLAYWFSPMDKAIFLILPPFIMITSVSVVILSLFTVKHFEIPFKKIADNIESLMLNNDKNKFNQHFVIEEFIYLQEFILKVFDIKEEKEAAKNALISLTTQVAHDIRSPVAAINTAINTISIPENKRTLIRNAVKRINEIANNLLLQYKNNFLVTYETIKNNHESFELVFSVLENIVAEKRYEYYKSGVNISLIISDSSYNCFTRIHLESFNRTLSNLINNSMEAINLNGSIDISLTCNDSHIEIIIEDNGCGMSPNILKKVIDQGFSFNKETGVGLGLSYAKHYLEQVGGSMHICSEEKIGTKIHLSLVRSHHPNWFCDTLYITYDMNIVILDDDASIHGAWNEKFEHIPRVKIKHLYNASELLAHQIDQHAHLLYLVDYELLSGGKNGLDIIAELNLNDQAILVTSCIDDITIRNRCENIGVKIIPKSYVPYIKITPIPTFSNRIAAATKERAIVTNYY